MASFQGNTFTNGGTIDLGSDNMVVDSVFHNCNLVLHQDCVLAESCTASGTFSLRMGDEFDGGNEAYAPSGDYTTYLIEIQGVI